MFSRVRGALNHLWNGSKLLFVHSQRVREMKKKDREDWTRTDRLFVEQFNYDIQVGIPFVSLFALPIIGYTAPILALLAPRYLPSTLILPEQKKRFLCEDSVVSRSLIDSLIEFNLNRVDDHRMSSLLSTCQLLNEVMEVEKKDRRSRIIDSSVRHSRLFEESMSLEQLHGRHLLNVHRCVLHSSFLSKSFRGDLSLQRDLDRWEDRILRDDQSINDVNDLSRRDLVESLVRRGFYIHLPQMKQILVDDRSTTTTIEKEIEDDWKDLLQSWKRIHLNLREKKCLSISYLLHLPPLFFI